MNAFLPQPTSRLLSGVSTLSFERAPTTPAETIVSVPTMQRRCRERGAYGAAEIAVNRPPRLAKTRNEDRWASRQKTGKLREWAAVGRRFSGSGHPHRQARGAQAAIVRYRQLITKGAGKSKASGTKTKRN